MTDEKRTDEAQEEEVIEQLLDGLNRVESGTDPVEALGGLVDEPLPRAYLETIGLLGGANEPMAPSLEVKERLLLALEAEGASADEAPALPPLPFVRERSVAVVAPSELWSRWPLRLAATLVLALLGLSGWQLVRIEKQQQTVAQLTGQLRDARQQIVQFADLDNRRKDAQAKLSVVTSPGVEICRLSPVGDQPLQPESRGALYVAADHQHWYLKVDGLSPCPQGHAYQLWFITEGGHSVSVGTFHVDSGVRLELSSETMPTGTVAVSITLEPVGGSPQPSGPPVLYGDEAMRIL